VQLTTLLVESLKSGKVIISQNNVEAVEVNVQNKKIDVNAKDKQFIKEIVSSARKGSTQKGLMESLHRGIDGIREVRKATPWIREIVEDLCREGITITVSYKGDRVVTMGADANSKLTRLITGTKGIEINSPIKLAEMGI
jgi:hypothetical protein